MKIPKSIVEQLQQQAEQGLPNEVCGFLAGVQDEVKCHYELTNLDQSPEHFTMDPKEQLAAIKDMRQKGYTLLGCYHSHPETPARPSDEDIRLAFDPSITYVIMSLKGGAFDIKAFNIKGVDVTPEPLEVISL